MTPAESHRRIPVFYSRATASLAPPQRCSIRSCWANGDRRPATRTTEDPQTSPSPPMRSTRRRRRRAGSHFTTCRREASMPLQKGGRPRGKRASWARLVLRPGMCLFPSCNDLPTSALLFCSLIFLIFHFIYGDWYTSFSHAILTKECSVRGHTSHTCIWFESWE